MAYTLGNKCAKNICKRTVLLQLIIKKKRGHMLFWSLYLQFYYVSVAVVPGLFYSGLPLLTIGLDRTSLLVRFHLNLLFDFT